MEKNQADERGPAPGAFGRSIEEFLGFSGDISHMCFEINAIGIEGQTEVVISLNEWEGLAIDLERNGGRNVVIDNPGLVNIDTNTIIDTPGGCQSQHSFGNRKRGGLEFDVVSEE